MVTRTVVLLAVLAFLGSAYGHADLESGAPASAHLPPVFRSIAATTGARDTATAVQAEMHNVDFHIDSGIVLHITRLRGQLIRTAPDQPPALDDKRSFILGIQSAEIAIDTESLGTLLNRHVFGYAGSPLRNLRLRIDGDHLVQTGVMGTKAGVKFTMRATVALTPNGEIRLHPTSVRVIGVKVGGLMKVFGVHLDGLMRLEPGHGARIERDDIILDPTGMLPAPGIRGRLTSIRVVAGGIAQTFGPAEPIPPNPLRGTGTAVPNYMYFLGGTLRFGRMTMTDADLEIVDINPGTPFDFSLDRYNEQLVAGYSRSTAAHALVVHMPDLGSLRPGTEALRVPGGLQ